MALESIYDDVTLLQEQVAELQQQMSTLQNSISTVNTSLQEIAVSVESLQEYKNYKAIQANADLDDLGPGHYFIPDYDTCITITHRPDTTGQTAAIDVMIAGGTGQLIMVYRGCIKEYIDVYMRVYYADGWGEWLKVNDDSGWLDLPLNDGWSMNDYNTDKPQYRKLGKLVMFRGLVNATSAAGTQIATLPVGFRPSANSFSRWRCPLNQTDAVNIQVGTNGIINDYAKGTASRSFIALSGICYLVD